MQSKYEALAILVGGIAVAFAVILSVQVLIRDGEGLWAIPLVICVLWRELVFSQIRARVKRN